jgi:CheY-like chemotaxis protein
MLTLIHQVPVQPPPFPCGLVGAPPSLRGAPHLEPSGEGEAGAASARSILVVDDDDDVRDSVRLLLEDEGYDVHTAADGREALALLRRIPLPGLALVDLRMPVMDGVELIHAIRRDARLARLPVLAFSAGSTLAPPPGVPLLQKPIGLQRLLDAIRSHTAS